MKRAIRTRTNCRFWQCPLVAAMLLSCVSVAHAVTAAETAGDAARGRAAIERRGCVACHVVPGIAGPLSNVGPPLFGIGRRGYIAGVLPNTPAAMARWLLDPPAISPRTAMPALGIGADEARDIAAYLARIK